MRPSQETRGETVGSVVEEEKTGRRREENPGDGREIGGSKKQKRCGMGTLFTHNDNLALFESTVSYSKPADAF
jgi:hypothetical protein